jgi:predicted TIM-barrel fold metal-dependent hydrolase
VTVIDAYVHLWDLAARPQPWTAEFPALQRSFLLPDLELVLDSHGVDAAVAVQAGDTTGETLDLLQFPMRHPAVTFVVAGMRTAAEVRTAVRYLAEPVPDAAWTELEASARLGETAHAGEDPYTDRRRRA